MASRRLVSETMRHELGDDPTLVQNLVPDFGLGCRRMTPGPDYLKSLTKSNVEVVSEGVARLTEDGVVDLSGVERKVDVVICANYWFQHVIQPSIRCHWPQRTESECRVFQIPSRLSGDHGRRISELLQ